MIFVVTVLLIVSVVACYICYETGVTKGCERGIKSESDRIHRLRLEEEASRLKVRREADSKRRSRR